MSVHYTPQTKKHPESPTLASMSGGQARGSRLLVCNLLLLLLLLFLFLLLLPLVLQPWSDGGCLVGLCLPAWAAPTNSLPALLFFCQRRRLSGVPSRHVAVATGVKGRMKEQVPSLFFSFFTPDPSSPPLLPLLSKPPSPHPQPPLCPAPPDHSPPPSTPAFVILFAPPHTLELGG